MGIDFMRLVFKTVLPVFFSFIFFCGSVQAAPKKLLVVHSYHPEYAWTSGITRGIKRTFYQKDIEMHIFYMDSKRKSLEHQKRAMGQEALSVVEALKPDVLITVDDDAQEFCAKHLAGRKSPRIIFCGVNAELSQYNYPASNMTGILERPHFAESMELLKSLVPGVRKVALLGDDTTTSSAAFDYIMRFKDDYKDTQIVSVFLAKTFEEWKNMVLDLQTRVDAIVLYTYHILKDEFGNTVDSSDILNWTLMHSKVPVVGLFSFTIDGGALCGVVESSMEQGREAATIARAILFEKKEIKDFPPKVARGSCSMLNLTCAQKHGIEVKEDLKDSIDIVF